jgi:hypothetical protein
MKSIGQPEEESTMNRELFMGLKGSFLRRRDLTRAWVLAVAGLFLLAMVGTASSPRAVSFRQGQLVPALLEDDFTKDTSLNMGLWTDNSAFLVSLAAASSSPPASFVVPTLSFSPSGMKMTGPTKDFETTGVQSQATFAPPFTVLVWATAVKGTANPFEIFLANSDLSEFVTVTANVSPAFDGMWATAPNVSQLWKLGEQFQPTITPALNALYRVLITVNAQGVGSVTMEDSIGKVSGSVFSLQPGTGPFYLVLGQRIGNAPPGPQVVRWKYVSVVN